MWHYSAFGGILRSGVEFPELCTTPARAADWTLEQVDGEPADIDLAPLGERRIGAESYRLWKTPTGYRLEYSHAGVFELDVASSVMRWFQREGAPPELVRSIVIGPLMALALEHTGLLCLHGSGVVSASGAIAFVGPKHHGKSTIALALTRAGCRLISDDLLAVAPGPVPVVRPGIATMRLWRDAHDSLPTTELCNTVIAGPKNTLGGFTERTVANEPAPLRAVYLLQPVSAESGAAAASRSELTGAAAAIALAQQRKLADGLVGFSAAGAQLATAAAVARAVPVYTLRVARDFSLIDAAVRQLLEWHGGPVFAAGASGS